MASLQKNVASQNVTFALVNATTGAALTGATVSTASKISKDGGAQAGVAGTFTELGGGQYLYAPTQSETNATAVGLIFIATNAIPTNMHFFTDPGVLLTAGTGSNQIALSSGAVTVGTNNDKTGYSLTQAFPSNFSSLSITAAGLVAVTSNIKKNAASRLTFTMTDSTSHNPKTGLTVSGQVSIDGVAFASLTNAVTEISNGDYTVSLAAADTNGNALMFRFTATGADDLNIFALSQP